LTKGRIAATHGQFNGIHQVPPVCTPYNTNSSLSPQPKGISIGSAIFAQLMAECRRACTFP